jgi:hypothetical protein
VQHVRGSTTHQPELHRLYEVSGLATSGLIDLAVLIEVTRSNPKAIPDVHFQDTVNAALFLQGQADRIELSNR